VAPKRRAARGEEPGAGRRADHAEGPQGQLDRACGWSLPHHEIELEVLHGRIERLLHNVIQAVDLVDEEDLSPLEIGENRRQIAGPLQHRPRRGADPDGELVGDHVGERGLAEARGP